MNDLVEIFTPIFLFLIPDFNYSNSNLYSYFNFQIFQIYQLKSKCEYKSYYFKYYYFVLFSYLTLTIVVFITNFFSPYLIPKAL
jgi:hypothetical protein